MAAKAVHSPCPKCKSDLRLIVETESKPRTLIVSYLYVCDVCKYRRLVDSVTLKMDGDKIVVLKGVFNKFS